MHSMMRGVCAAACLIAAAASMARAARASRPFGIQVVDEQTGRGVPLVELTTVANVRYWTDSAGWAAIDDPVLDGHKVFFSVASHGYAFPADGFGYHGTAVDVEPGQTAVLKIRRINVAERLYRITGEGIYRDSIMLGRPAPIRQPLLDGLVSGQDSTQEATYRGQLYWFFGDTNRPSYPLGQFGTSGATSPIPNLGGIDPALGVNLEYFVGRDGFSRPIFPDAGPHPIWLDALFVLRDPATQGERLIAAASVMQNLGHCLSRRLVVFNEKTQLFETALDIALDAPIRPEGHALLDSSDGIARVYFGNAFPDRRVRADWASIHDLSSYEAFTCLAPGSRWDADHPALDRDPAGRLIWGWKRNTAPLARQQVRALLAAGRIKPAEVWFEPLDVDTRRPVTVAMSSVAYNAFRKRWIMIACQTGGSSSMLGEIWYSEADRPEGPWRWARKVVTHDRYSMYNPCQHPALQQADGRLIFFDGTYTTTFSGNDHPTPRYDYNPIMYRLDLADPRLKLPAN